MRRYTLEEAFDLACELLDDHGCSIVTQDADTAHHTYGTLEDCLVIEDEWKRYVIRHGFYTLETVMFPAMILYEMSDAGEAMENKHWVVSQLSFLAIEAIVLA